MEHKMDIQELIDGSEKSLSKEFRKIDDIALYNQEKVLAAFQKNRVALRHFAPTTGYGYDDIGRDTLAKVFADAFSAESAIVSPLLANGSHAISTVLFGLLRPGDMLYSASGSPYDTLIDVITGENIGSLRDYGIKFAKEDLIDGQFDLRSIENFAAKNKPKVVFLQRSRGYSSRNAFTVKTLKTVIDIVKSASKDSIVVVDNCYGEFVEKQEPIEAGADIIVGSLIKNPGGGLAPTGGYIAGKETLIQLISYRLTSPGIGCEVGSYANTYQYFYQGFFMAPHVVAQALKAAQLFCRTFDKLNYNVLPKPGDDYGDIIASINFNTAKELIDFVQTIQSVSPVDSYVLPEPWDMPGYNHQVIMAAGTFVQGASIELSADSPIKAPYIAYFQGALTYEHAKIALKNCLKKLFG
ncbi:MAG TPA: methionine gamma-lyase family protein [Firmicutes bacterium]|nr:methionine gamma-lyase family protein [Bacillota bacterium]